MAEQCVVAEPTRRRRRAIAALAAAVVLTGAGAGPVMAAAGPRGHNNRGLCTAYFNGSQRGRENKRRAKPFVALEKAAAEKGQTVAQFCAGMVGGRAGR